MKNLKSFSVMAAVALLLGFSTVACDLLNNKSHNNNNNNGPKAPEAPRYVQASAESSSSIRITWGLSNIRLDEVWYCRVYRSLSAYGGYAMIGGASSTFEYTDTGLDANTTYYYKVSVSVGGLESELSDINSATTLNDTSSVAGALPENAITIPSGSYVFGSFPSGLDAVWYIFTKNGTGNFFASDRDYSSTYSGDIVVDIYDVNLNIISIGSVVQYDIDVGDSTTLIYANWIGTYYVKVRPYNNDNSNKGTFALFAP